MSRSSNDPRACQVNIAIMRAFVRLREAVIHHERLAAKIAASSGSMTGSSLPYSRRSGN